MAYGVFASIFPLLCLYFIRFSSSSLLFCPFVLPFASLFLSALACPFALSFLSWFVFVVSFSLTDYMQKKGRSVLVRPLFVCCVCVQIGYSAASGITKLLQAVSILNELPEIQATEN